MSFPSFIAGLVVGLIPFLVAAWLWRRKAHQFRDEKAQLKAEHEENLSELNAERNEDLSNLEEAHHRNLEELRVLVARGMKWEGGSRQHLIEACEVIGVNGFVATNVSFLVQNRGSDAYIHQIDHLIVSDHMLFVVEAKNWQGTIYHRERYKNGYDPLSIDALPVLNEIAPEERYVLQVKDNDAMMLHPKGETPEPVKQVEAQSKNFRKYLASRLGADPGHTLNCVFYSHRTSRLVGGARTFGKYTWATDKHELPAVLEQMQQHRRSTHAHPVRLHDIYEIVWALGADIQGVGTYAEQWQSPFPEGFEKRYFKHAQS